MRTHGQICIHMQFLHICKICTRQMWSCVQGFRDKRHSWGSNVLNLNTTTDDSKLTSCGFWFDAFYACGLKKRSGN